MSDLEPGRVVLVRPGGPGIAGKQANLIFPGISLQTAGAQGLCMHQVKIPPGARERPHRHNGHESAIYVVEGTAGGYWGPDLDQPICAGPGDFVYVPAGVIHQPANASSTKWLVAIIARTDPNEQESVEVLPELE